MPLSSVCVSLLYRRVMSTTNPMWRSTGTAHALHTGTEYIAPSRNMVVLSQCMCCAIQESHFGACSHQEAFSGRPDAHMRLCDRVLDRSYLLKYAQI
mmetsp:Transcript_33745/g.55175  ORF Transcript_33745/g.55175 Transcript_33745/m.55175 type:complete len:97 (+) Transcript_33745:223-513(+)